MTTRSATDAADEGVLQGVTRALHDVRAAHDAYVQEQRAAWRRYADAVDQALHDDLGVDDGPDHPIDDLAGELLDGLRARMDDLRVQARLGRMELDDLVAELRRAATALAAAVRP
jgi:hypothetical protein